MDDNILEQTKYPVWDDFLPVVPPSVVQAAADGYTQIIAASNIGPRLVELGVSDAVYLYIGESAPSDDTGSIRVEQVLRRVLPEGLSLYAKSLSTSTTTDDSGDDMDMGDDTGDDTGTSEIEITIAPALFDHVEDDDPLIFPPTFSIRLAGAVTSGATQLQVNSDTEDSVLSGDLVAAARYFSVDGQTQIYEITSSAPALITGQGRVVTFIPALTADVADDTLMRFANSYVPNRGALQRLAFTVQADVMAGLTSLRLIGSGPDNLSGASNLAAGQSFVIDGRTTEYTISAVTELSAETVPPNGAHEVEFTPVLDADVSAEDRIVLDLRPRLDAYDVTLQRNYRAGVTQLRFVGDGLADINNGDRITFPEFELSYLLSGRIELSGQTVRRFDITPALEADLNAGVAPLMPIQSIGDELDAALRQARTAGANGLSFGGSDALLFVVGYQFTFEGHTSIYEVQTTQQFPSTSPPISNITISPVLDADVAMGTNALPLTYVGPGATAISTFVAKENTDGITLSGSGGNPGLSGANVANIADGDTFTIAGLPETIYTITDAATAFGTLRFPTVSPIIPTAHSGVEILIGVGTPGTVSVLDVAINNDGGYDTGATELMVDGDDTGNIVVGHIFGIDHLGDVQLVTAVPEPPDPPDPPDPTPTAAATDVSVQTWDDIEPGV